MSAETPDMPSIEQLLAQQRARPRTVGNMSIRAVEENNATEFLEAKKRREEATKAAIDRIKAEAMTVAKRLAELEFEPEVTVIRERIKPAQYHRHHQKLKPTEEISGWLLTASHKPYSPQRKQSAYHEGFVLGENGEIYSYHTRHLSELTVESKFSGVTTMHFLPHRYAETPEDSNFKLFEREHRSLTQEDNKPLVMPVQIDEEGRYHEDAEVMDAIYAASDFIGGVAPADRARCEDFVHGVGIRDALAHLLYEAMPPEAPPQE